MYSGIKSSRNGYASINYPMADKQVQLVERIGAFRCGGGILDTGNVRGIRAQFACVWKRAGRMIGDIQAYALLFSFSRNELPPDADDSLDRAADMAAAAIEKLYPDHQYTVVAQQDGASGLIHVHGIVNAINSITIKAARGRPTSYMGVRDAIENEMEENGIEIDYGERHKKMRAKIRAKEEKAMGHDKYSWMDDLRRRVSNAIENSTSFGDFETNLSENGVGVARKGKSNWTFVLCDSPVDEYSGRKARGDKLGPDYVIPEIRKIFQRKRRTRQAENMLAQRVNFNTDDSDPLSYEKKWG